MTLTLDIPEALAENLTASGKDPAREALEAIALEAYRTESLTDMQIRDMLGITCLNDFDGFLKSHGVFYDMTIEDVLKDAETVRRVVAKKAAARRSR